MKTLLGQRIREQRRKKGWTMDKLAEKADLSVNYLKNGLLPHYEMQGMS